MALDHLRHIRSEHRRVILILGIIATLVLIGLTVTGIWQFFMHEPDRGWSGYTSDQKNFPVGANPPGGIEELHGFLADVGAILTLFAGAWLSVTVLHRLSWTSAASFVILVFAILTGESIRFNASISDGLVDIDTTGYMQFFNGHAQRAVTDRFELGVGPIVIWTLLHIITVPVLVGSSWYAINSERKKRAQRAARGPTWLEGLDHAEVRS